MADLVRDDVGLREVAGRVEALLQLLHEREIEIDLVVARAVERADGRRRVAAGGLDGVVVKDDHRRLVRLAALDEELLPGRVDVPGDEVDELRRIVRGRLVQVRRRCARRLRELARAGVDSETTTAAPGLKEQEEEDEQDRPDAAAAHLAHRDRAAAEAAAAAAAAILDPACSSTSAPLHDRVCSRGGDSYAWEVRGSGRSPSLVPARTRLRRRAGRRCLRPTSRWSPPSAGGLKLPLPRTPLTASVFCAYVIVACAIASAFCPRTVGVRICVRVACRVVARVVRDSRGAAVNRRLGGRLHAFRAGEQAAGGDALRDERPIVGATAEGRSLGAARPCEAKYAWNSCLDAPEPGGPAADPARRGRRSCRRRRRSGRSSATRPCRSSGSERSGRARPATGCRRTGSNRSGSTPQRSTRRNGPCFAASPSPSGLRSRGSLRSRTRCR